MSSTSETIAELLSTLGCYSLDALISPVIRTSAGRTAPSACCSKTTNSWRTQSSAVQLLSSPAEEIATLGRRRQRAQIGAYADERSVGLFPNIRDSCYLRARDINEASAMAAWALQTVGSRSLLARLDG